MRNPLKLAEQVIIATRGLAERDLRAAQSRALEALENYGEEIDSATAGAMPIAPLERRAVELFRVARAFRAFDGPPMPAARAVPVTLVVVRVSRDSRTWVELRNGDRCLCVCSTEPRAIAGKILALFLGARAEQLSAFNFARDHEASLARSGAWFIADDVHRWAAREQG